MTTLEVVHWSTVLNREGFRSRLGAPALLVPGLQDSTPTLSEDDSTASRRALVDNQTEITIDLDGYVLPLVRAPQNPFSDKLAVGRTRNCDLRIDHRSISRLHALLLREPDGGWSLVDAGSSNGTRLDGEPVGKQPVRLRFGHILGFGSVSTQFVSEDMLYEALRNLQPLGP